MEEEFDYLSLFKMPKSTSINGRSSSITNAFVGSIIPIIEPSKEEVKELLSILGMTNGKIECAYCGSPYTEWDHLNPIVKDKRETGYISEINNLVPSCGKCNQSKGNKNWKKWIDSSTRLSPKSRGIKDLELRKKRLKELEKCLKPVKLDLEEILDTKTLEMHWNNRDQILSLMKESQKLAEEIKKQTLLKVRNMKKKY